MPHEPDHAALMDVGVHAFDQVVRGTPGFRVREGQRAMAVRVAEALAGGDLGEAQAPAVSIAVIQAGTGVGKSAAYASTAIALALARKTRVLISTATVALQEQLMQKDLPALAGAMEQPFAFALAKGRGRYVCVLKLHRLSGGALDDGDDLFDDDFAPAVPANASQEAAAERRVQLYAHLGKQLAQGTWQGDRDTLADPPDGADWAAIAAERHSCTARHCPHFKECAYYQARNQLAQAQVIVANHDLVLSSIGMKTLPDLHNCLVIFDEGHHLPAVALDQFSSSMDLSNLRWLERLPKVMQGISSALQVALVEDIATLCSQLRATMTQLARMALDMLPPTDKGQADTLRFAHGVLPEAWHAPVAQIHAQAHAVFKSMEELGAAVKALAKEDPAQARTCAQHYAKLGGLAPRLSAAVATCKLLLEHGAQPLAKWLSVKVDGPFLTVAAHACPMVPGDLLRQFLWSQVRSAVVTSASLTSCGSFDYFLKEAGLFDTAHVSTLEVSSPFDYAAQGSLTVVQTRAEPKDAVGYTREMVQALMEDLAQVDSGALVLFTSRAQMRAAADALPAALVECTHIQGSSSRARLLAAHTARVEAGLPSILFGLQSFGEGLDLPGKLCETVFIAKLPFAPPSEPVDEARAEWLRSVGRDPFNELVVPATGIKLLQWTGRAIRTEEDRARVVCYDKRLLLTAYGKRMLAGLPPYRLVNRAPN